MVNQNSPTVALDFFSSVCEKILTCDMLQSVITRLKGIQNDEAAKT